MYKLIARIVINCAVIFGIIYLAASFILNKYNPTQWTQDQRFLLIMLWVMCLVVAIPATVYDYNESKN